MRADHTFQGTVAGFRKLCTETHTGFEDFLRMCVKARQGSTRVMQPSGMPSVMHTAAHSHKIRKICSDALLINDGGSVNMYIVPYFKMYRPSGSRRKTGKEAGIFL